MIHELRFTPQAEEDLSKLTRADQRLAHRVLSKLETLSEQPYQGKPLVGQHAGHRSLRIGTYRVVYRIEETSQWVIILTGKHCRNVY